MISKALPFAAGLFICFQGGWFVQSLMPFRETYALLGLFEPFQPTPAVLERVRARRVEPAEEVAAAGQDSEQKQPSPKAQRPPAPLANRTSVLAVQVACLK